MGLLELKHNYFELQFQFHLKLQKIETVLIYKRFFISNTRTNVSSSRVKEKKNENNNPIY